MNRKNKTIGFIILRYVNDSNTNKYWIRSYECIRKFYPEYPIMIIDDNSNEEYLTTMELYKTTIIKSEYPRRGELLPYYYYLHNKFVDIAVIIHDSVFINNAHLDFSVDTYKMLWYFEHHWDQHEDELLMINVFNDEKLKEFYHDKGAWKGCFGGMSIIAHDYLEYVNYNYKLEKRLDFVLTRYNRCSFERVIAVLLQIYIKENTLLGDIHQYGLWELSYENVDTYRYLPIIKVWTGR